MACGLGREAARFSPFRRGPLDVMLGRRTLDSSPMYVAMDLMSRLVSPYTMNPMGKNPLGEILAELIDFELLAQSPIHLFVTATNVRTGRGKVFKNAAVTPRRGRIVLRLDPAAPCRPARRSAIGLAAARTLRWPLVSGPVGCAAWAMRGRPVVGRRAVMRRPMNRRAVVNGRARPVDDAWVAPAMPSGGAAPAEPALPCEAALVPARAAPG
jgi:hypothetical protein